MSITAMELETLVSVERFAPYRRVARNHTGAVPLYEWNIKVSGALLEVLAIVEVVVRNSFSQQLARKQKGRGSDSPWYLAPWLVGRSAADVRAARRRATGDGRRQETGGAVLAELSFGFWRYLVAKRFTTTAWPALQQAFLFHPAAPRVPRSDVEVRMQRLHVLRNRIAHHEPLLRRSLGRDHEAMLDLLGWISQPAERWAADITRVPSLLASKPRTSA